MYPDEFVPSLEPAEADLTMRVTGWLLLVHDAMFIALFVPASLRVGSVIWPVWVVVMGLAGVALAVAGAEKEERSIAIEGRIVPMRPRKIEPRQAA